ncbi:MAG: tRNA (N(6)-L-threonylcarbamoyladenosine(37)-C(2))-methylthiotransferase MtaB [Bacilli bacterium]|nr:tRNA (N(6)-L-threonylcarbamoyladenosine(37)-C(2))-methylthiotransferase MtaB [Bacilli bacterium]
MKVAFYSLGCKVNAYETEYLINEFKKKDYEIVPFSEKADIYIINTCTVTNTSDQKSRKIIRNACKNKDAVIVVMGCYSQIKPEVVSDIDGVSIVLGNKDKNKVVELVETYLKDRKNYKHIYDLSTCEFEDMYLDKFENHTRSFVKIQDGCNNYCSYCIIPYSRGNVRSKDKNIVISEVKALASNGYKEVVLTGIHTGHYGQDLKEYDFSDLLMELEKIDGLERIRISSIEITELTDKFLDTLKNSKKIVNHLHIPLQSGCDKILKLMNRKYDMNYYIDKINKIRKIRPDIAITTDVIVGFPSETDEDFNTTKENIKKIKFAELHVFPYSKREGTKASKMSNQIDGNIKKQRVKELLKISKNLKEEFYKKYVNTYDYVLTENFENGYLIGHLSNYGKVRFKGDKKNLNKIIKVKLLSYNDNIFNSEEENVYEYC